MIFHLSKLEGARLNVDGVDLELEEAKISGNVVWPPVYTYTLTNLTVYYTRNSYLLPTKGNSAYINATLNTLVDGEIISSETVRCTPVNHQSCDYIVIESGFVKWNKTGYGTTAVTAGTTMMKASYVVNGVTITSAGTVSVAYGANSATPTLTRRTLTLDARTSPIACTTTSISVIPYLTNYYTLTWTSGETSSDTDEEGRISIYVNGSLRTSQAYSGVIKTITSIGDNKHTLDPRSIVCYALIESTLSADLIIEQEPDSQYSGSPTVRGYFVSVAQVVSNTISASGGAARYEIDAYHEVVTVRYWTSDGAQVGDPTVDRVTDSWGYNLTAGDDTYFTASQSGKYFDLTHQNMLKRATTDTVSYEFYNASSPTVKTSAYMFDATNAITGSTYRVSLEVESTTVSAMEQTIDITRALHITDNTYTSGSTDTVTVAGNSELSLIGTGYTFWDSKTRVHVTKNTGSSTRVANLTLHWGAHELSQVITLTQEAAIVPITFTVTPTSKTIDYREQSILYTIVAQGAWTATPNKDWLHGGSEEGSVQVAFFVDENTGHTIRSGTLTFTCGSETVTVTIIQTRNMSV